MRRKVDSGVCKEVVNQGTKSSGLSFEIVHYSGIVGYLLRAKQKLHNGHQVRSKNNDDKAPKAVFGFTSVETDVHNASTVKVCSY